MVEIISQPDSPIVFGQLGLIAVMKFGSAASVRVLLSRVLLKTRYRLPTFTQRELVYVTSTVRDISSSGLH